MTDMLVNLMELDFIANQKIRENGFVIRRPHIVDKTKIIDFIKNRWGSHSDSWQNEMELALSRTPPTCFVASKGSQIVGFCCYDTTGKGFFGPVGVDENYRGYGLGVELLLIGLDALKNDGYAYGIIGWVSGTKFYADHCGAIEIPESEPHKSIYKNMLRLRDVD